MYNFLWAIGASIAVSAVSFIGIFGFLIKEDLLNRILVILIGFSAGGLIGGAFLHLMPEALEAAPASQVFVFVIIGFVFFFILERYLYWRHCHHGNCQVHTFTYLNLIGDGIHNFIDGLVIGSSFMVSVHFGIVTTVIILVHEIPQEIGDFGVLVYGGFSKARALAFNFLSGIVCVFGAALGCKLSTQIANFTLYLLPLTAGGFIYIAACDLIPEIHKQTSLKRASFAILAFCIGVLFIWGARFMHQH